MERRDHVRILPAGKRDDGKKGGIGNGPRAQKCCDEVLGFAGREAKGCRGRDRMMCGRWNERSLKGYGGGITEVGQVKFVA